jgi:hypothetical protein
MSRGIVHRRAAPGGSCAWTRGKRPVANDCHR